MDDRQGRTWFVVVTGLSGAGKSSALRNLEDLGFFCMDNIPPKLLPPLVEILAEDESIDRVAVVIDIRGGRFFDRTLDALAALEAEGIPCTILFLEASDDSLVRRYKETRRPHPLAQEGRTLQALKDERLRLEELRGRAQHVIDTSRLSPGELRERIFDIFGGGDTLSRMLVSLVSFGFKHGLPSDADLILDVRFLPNPHYVESLRPLTGLDAEVRDYVWKWPVSQNLFRRVLTFLTFLLPHYQSEGKAQLRVGIGCTGGRHRSVALSERLADILQRRGYAVAVEHRDIEYPSAEG